MPSVGAKIFGKTNADVRIRIRVAKIFVCSD